MNLNRFRSSIFFGLIVFIFAFSITGCEVNDDDSESWNIDIKQNISPGRGELLVTPTYGGKVSASNSMSAIDIPAGAIDDPVKISVRPVAHEDDYIELEKGRVFLGAVDFTPFASVFKCKVKVTVAISEYKTPGTYYEVFRLETTQGTPVAYNSINREFTGISKPSVWKKTSLLGKVDQSGYSITLETDHLYTYAIIDYQGLNENLMITSILPGTGSTGGVIKIYGTGFGSSRQDSMVYFGNTPVTVYLRWSNSLIEGVIPDNAVSSEVRIEKAGMSSNTIRMNISDSLNPPRIDSVFPQSGSPGATITVKGARFGKLRSDSHVNISGVKALNYTLWSDTEIHFGLPLGAASGDLSVIVDSIVSNTSSFVVIEASFAEPAITGVSPEAISIGEKAVISGFGFGNTIAASSLGVNGVNVNSSLISLWSDSKIEFTVPVGAYDGNICVSVNSRISNGFPCRVSQPVPVINSITPSSAYSGDTVTVSGSGFGVIQDLSRVRINELAITDYSYWDDSTIMFKVPDGIKSGILSVTVLERMSNTVSFRFIESAAWKLYSEYLDSDIRDIDKSPSNVLWACGGAETGNGFVRHYDGNTWQAENISAGNALNSLAFSGNIIYAAGGKSNSSTLLRYSSGTWSDISLDYEGEIFKIEAVPGKNDLWLACEKGKFVYFDTVNWNTVNSPVQDNIYAMDFVTSSEAWAGGGDSSGGSGFLLHYSSAAWSEYQIPVNNAVYSIEFNAQNRGWAFCSGGVILFYNGSSWSKVESPAVYNIYDAFFIDPSHGWACGENGTLIRYFNGNWELDNTVPTSVTRFSIYFNAEKDGWSGGESGGLLQYSE